MPADLILGVDPGLNGALALIDFRGGLVLTMEAPTLQLKSKRELDEYRLAAWVDEHAGEIEACWIETAWPRPGEGSATSFGLGRTYGVLRGIVSANFIPCHDAHPNAWKKAMRVTGDKDESRRIASQIWPAHTAMWPLKKDHGKAEAALIAEYGRRKHLQQIGEAA